MPTASYYLGDVSIGSGTFIIGSMHVVGGAVNVTNSAGWLINVVNTANLTVFSINSTRQLTAGSALIGTANVLGTVSSQLIAGSVVIGTANVLGTVSSQLIAGSVVIGTASVLAIGEVAGRIIDTASTLRLVQYGSANLLASTTAQLAAAQGAALQACVFQVSVLSESNNLVTFLAGANTLSASFPVGSRSQLELGYNPHCWFKTSQNTVLNVAQNTSARTAVHIVFYAGV